MKNIIDAFQEVVVNNKDEISIVDNEKKLTYRELDILSDKISIFLEKELGNKVSKESIVAVHMDKSNLYVATILAILKLQCAFLPLDVKLPLKRKEYIINDCETEILLIDNSATDLYFGSCTRLRNKINLQEQLEKIEYETGELKKRKITPKNLAYVIYTSGSTGMPKGTLIEHKGLVNLKELWQKKIEVSSKDRILFFSNISFDASIWEIFMALFCGAKLYIPRMNIINNFSVFKEYVNENKITILTLPPTYALHLDFKKMNSLRILISAGSAASKKLIEKLQDTEATFINAYGPTEATICATTWIYNKYKELEDQIPIGDSIANMKTYVFDEKMNIVSKGESGELLIGGMGLARGYIKNEELNKKVFLNHPIYGLLYRTGDIVTKNKNGELIFKGRRDHQIKIHGHRIEIDEIKKQFLKANDVMEVEILVENNETLLAFYTTFSGNIVEKLENLMESTLPDYMIPRRIIHLHSFPLTNNGKIDRKQLLLNANQRSKTEANNEISYMERIQLNIWKEVFEDNSISVYDDFFVLGGDSIKAIQIVAKLYENGFILETKYILDKRKIISISPFIKNISENEEGEINGTIELLPIQKWFFDQKFYNPNQWNQSLLFFSDRRYEEKIICDTLNKVVEHHDVLRSKFIERNGQYIQKIDYYIYRKDLVNHVYIDSDSKEKIDIEIKKSQKSLSIEDGNIIKACLISCPLRDYLFINVHHLVCDGISLRILNEDFIKVYRSLKNMEGAVLPRKSVSLKKWASEINKLANDSCIKRDIDYWVNVEKGISEISMLNIDLNSENLDRKVNQVKLSEEKTNLLLKKANNAFNTKINDLLLTTLALTFKEVLGKSKIAFNLETHGRFTDILNLNISRTVGWFTVQYPIILSLHENDTVKEHIINVKEQLARIPNSGISYGTLKKNHPEILSYNKNLQVSFNYLGEIKNEVEDANFKVNNETFAKTFGPDGYENLSSLDRNYFKLNITSYVIGNNFYINFSSSENILKNNKLLNLADVYLLMLNKIIDICINTKEKIKTASDYSFDNLDNEQLKDILSKISLTI